MNKYICQYLSKVCGEIKYKGVTDDISEEIESHICEIADSYIETGMDEDEAIQKAITQMGDPIQIGKELNKTHRPKTEWSIIGLVGALVLIGGLTLITILSTESIQNQGQIPLNHSQILRTYLTYLPMGIGVCIGCYFFDYTKIEKHSLLIFGAAIGIWMSNSVINNPSGIIVLTMTLFIIAFAGLAKRWGSGNIKDMLKLVGLAMLAMVLISNTHVRSFGFVLLFGAGLLTVLTLAIMSKDFAGNKSRFIFSIYGGALLAKILLLAGHLTSYRMSRFLAIIRPDSSQNSSGWIISISRDAVSNAELIGRSDSLYYWQDGANKLILPDVHTDYIFTYIISTFGLLIGLVTLGIMVCVLTRMFMATRSIRHSYGRYLASAIVVLFTIQGLGNILMSVGLMPHLGFSLPLISYGGTSFVINMALIGVLLGIYRRKDLVMAGKKA
ncbi:FtsW/RodA/SpoVE family cell cycle protein [Proteinivorax tanatarense]|uniref:FtsW/RodA/SpoVE family cell cycle protein n=1 Tax=Proteinivorax tanatarense TaxID=1260629 RepID=A0AAU7VLC5_9FIRM